MSNIFAVILLLVYRLSAHRSTTPISSHHVNLIRSRMAIPYYNTDIDAVMRINLCARRGECRVSGQTRKTSRKKSGREPFTFCKVVVGCRFVALTKHNQPARCTPQRYRSTRCCCCDRHQYLASKYNDGQVLDCGMSAGSECPIYCQVLLLVR